tara:strand:+ start:218 stop:457 length:240 start_codon:yes stop_codon:yes gene_type:complete
MKKNYKYTCFMRSTSNVITKKDMYQISLPPHVWKRMGWKINEVLEMILIRDEDEQRVVIKKENKYPGKSKHYYNRQNEN